MACVPVVADPFEAEALAVGGDELMIGVYGVIELEYRGCNS